MAFGFYFNRFNHNFLHAKSTEFFWFCKLNREKVERNEEDREKESNQKAAQQRLYFE